MPFVRLFVFRRLPLSLSLSISISLSLHLTAISLLARLCSVAAIRSTTTRKSNQKATSASLLPLSQSESALNLCSGGRHRRRHHIGSNRRPTDKTADSRHRCRVSTAAASVTSTTNADLLQLTNILWFHFAPKQQQQRRRRRRPFNLLPSSAIVVASFIGDQCVS